MVWIPALPDYSLSQCPRRQFWRAVGMKVDSCSHVFRTCSLPLWKVVKITHLHLCLSTLRFVTAAGTHGGRTPTNNRLLSSPHVYLSSEGCKIPVFIKKKHFHHAQSFVFSTECGQTALFTRDFLTLTTLPQGFFLKQTQMSSKTVNKVRDWPNVMIILVNFNS